MLIARGDRISHVQSLNQNTSEEAKIEANEPKIGGGGISKRSIRWFYTHYIWMAARML